MRCIRILKFLFLFCTTAKSRTIALKTNPHLPKLSIKLELKPEHQNPAFYEDNSIGVNDDDDDVADNYEEDSNSVQSNQSSTAHLIDTSSSSTSFIATHSGTTTSSSSTTLLVNPAAVNSEKVRKSNNRTSVKKSQSPAPPTVRRKANSYIAVSGKIQHNSAYFPLSTKLLKCECINMYVHKFPCFFIHIR